MSASAVGGTFDIIHRGHMELLGRAFAEGDPVIIGLVGDGFAKRRGKSLLNPYEARRKTLEDVLRSGFAGRRFSISMLDGDFGPAILEEGVGVLVLSEETASQGEVLNGLRRCRGMSPARIVVVPMVMAEDGRRLSTSRIRASEVDSEGRLTR